MLNIIPIEDIKDKGEGREEKEEAKWKQKVNGKHGKEREKD